MCLTSSFPSLWPTTSRETLRDVISSLSLCDMPRFSVPRRYNCNPFSAKVLRFRWKDAETVPSVTKPGVSITRRDFLARTSKSFGSRRHSCTPFRQNPLDLEEVCGGGGGRGGKGGERGRSEKITVLPEMVLWGFVVNRRHSFTSWSQTSFFFFFFFIGPETIQPRLCKTTSLQQPNGAVSTPLRCVN